MSRQIEKINKRKVSKINGQNIYFDHRNYFIVVDGMRLVVDYDNNYNSFNN